jgi:hypothetical protein
VIGRLLFSALLLTLSCAAAAAGERRDGAYFCTGEFAGGLHYNTQLKKWEGATFRPEAKFIVRLKFLNSYKMAGGFQFEVDDYDVTITKAGTNTALSCSRLGETTARLHEFRMECSTGSEDYNFNFKFYRFIRVYAVGYVGGEDNNDDTPNILGGTCIKIN